jgi:sterol desaturase/sphingolipid hydroxylase (fatty acid hydroxylase superfamily)
MATAVVDAKTSTTVPRREAPALFRWTIFPIVLSGGVAWAWYRMSVDIGPAAAILLPQFAALAMIAVLEHVYPYHQRWRRPEHDVRVDATHSITLAILIALVTPFVLSAGVLVWGAFSRYVGSALWPTEWPLLIQIALALIVAELPGYWVHRWEHEWQGLWRFHATHHSAPRLYWLNAGRFHPIDTLMTFVPSFFLLALLGCNEKILAYFTLISAIHGAFQHANLQLRLGMLNYFFSMAELHRWHHSKTVEEANHNYGQTISIWDTVFGTRFLPADRSPPKEIGIADLPKFPMTWWAQILSPFRWNSIVEDEQRGMATDPVQ